MKKIEKVANYMLYVNPEGNMTPKKLQKLLFIAYGLFLVVYNDDKNHITERLFTNDFQAWTHGPVSPTIYHKYKDYGMRQISFTECCDFGLKNYEMEFINEVLLKFGKYKAYQLEDFTHKQKPWVNQREGLEWYEPSQNKILDSDIFDEYIEYVC